MTSICLSVPSSPQPSVHRLACIRYTRNALYGRVGSAKDKLCDYQPRMHRRGAVSYQGNDAAAEYIRYRGITTLNLCLFVVSLLAMCFDVYGQLYLGI